MSKQPNPSNQKLWAEPTKFNQLRNKTDLQLLHLINTELNLNIQDAREALRTADIWTVAGEFYRQTKTAQARISRLLPLISRITADEGIEMESKLANLRGILESLSAIGSTPTPTENDISALAHLVWEARGCPVGLPDEDWYRAERAFKAAAISGRPSCETITAASPSRFRARHQA